MVNSFYTKPHGDSKNEWLTPPELIKALGSFDLEPCSPIKRPWDTAFCHYTIEDDGFKMPWNGRVWLNPPYGRETFKWVKRLADHGDGIALIFARTETKGFHDQVWNRATAVFFFRDRINFYHVTGEKSDRANAPSCLIIYGNNNVEAINKAIDNGSIKGRLVIL